MRICFSDQSSKSDQLIEEFVEAKVMAYNKSNMLHKVTTLEVEIKGRLRDFDLSFIDRFEMFPNNILIGFTQWKKENRAIRVNDTIVDQMNLPPIKWILPKIIFGVRINEIYNTTTRYGYSYEALEGLIFKIETYSVPGSLLSTLVGPIFTLPYQAYCARKALQNSKLKFEQLNKQ